MAQDAQDLLLKNCCTYVRAWDSEGEKRKKIDVL